jgi:hypothetical protein
MPFLQAAYAAVHEMVAAIEAATALQAAYAAVHPRRRGTRLSPSIAKQTLP